MKLLQDLRKVSTKHSKNKLLNDATDIELAVFEYALDPYKVYHMQNFNVIEIDEGEPSLEMFDILDSLLAGVSGARAKEMVNAFAAKHGGLIKRICQKDLRCGVNAKTINSCWPGLVPVFEVQLAKEVPMDKIEFPKLVQIKYDGVRLITIKRGDHIVFRTRNGKEVNLPVLRKVMKRIAGDIILDGEITVASGKSADRTKVSGMINSAMHGGSIDEQSLIYSVFDTMMLEHWDNAECNVMYSDRLKMVHLFIEQIDSHLVDVAFTFKAFTRRSLEEKYDMFIAMGYEGLILKDENHYYSFKRSKDWIKLKEIKTVDLKCTDVVEGEGKYQGMVGALRCEGTVEDTEVTVFVGSGLTDSDRHLPDDAFIGKTIEVKYNAVIMDKVSRRYSLFLPRFVMVRYDK